MGDNEKKPKLEALNPDEVDSGMRFIHTELARGRAALWLGKGREGFAMLGGHTMVAQVGGTNGVVIGWPLKREQLQALRDRCQALLDGKDCSLILPVNALGGLG